MTLAGQPTADPATAQPVTAERGPTGTHRIRDVTTSIAAYCLLFFFWAVAAGLSANGLIGFGRDNMRLHNPWPYLLFFALDGAAAFCAVLLMRRAARAQSALAPRLAVWGLVAASATFNWEHAPNRPFAHAAFALMPVIAGVLFEFALHETKRSAGRQDRRMTAVRWLHPVERIRVQLALAGDEALPADLATRLVRCNRAAHHLYRLRRLSQTGAATWRQRRAERRAQAVLARADFADESNARQVLRQLQVLTQATTLATLDYSSAGDALAALSNLISATPPPHPISVEVEATGRLAADAATSDPGVRVQQRPGELEVLLAELAAQVNDGSHAEQPSRATRHASPDHDAEQALEAEPARISAAPQRTPAPRAGGIPIPTGTLAIDHDHLTAPSNARPTAGSSGGQVGRPAGNGSGSPDNGGARVIRLPGTTEWRDLLGRDIAQAAAAFVAHRETTGLPRRGAGVEFARLAADAGIGLSDRQLRSYVTQAYEDAANRSR